MDDSADGIQNEAAERRISGVKVTLLKLKDGGDPANESDYEPYHYQGDSNLPEVVIETGQIVSVRANSSADATDYELGRYKFIDLPAGTFAVRFEDGTTKISPLIASPSNHGTDDTQDSDGIATYSTDRSSLKQTVILGIELPRAEDMSVVLYESKYHDSGFYEKGHELPMTGGSGTNPYTIGGLLTIGAGFLLLYKKQKCVERRISHLPDAQKLVPIFFKFKKERKAKHETRRETCQPAAGPGHGSVPVRHSVRGRRNRHYYR